MMRSRTRASARRKGSSRRGRESKGTSRLAEMSARIDSARNASMVRRPLFDRMVEVAAYEIVLGDGPINAFGVEDRDGANHLIVNSAVSLDLAQISPDKPVLLTVSSAVLEAGLPPVLVSDRAVLVLGGGVEPSEATTSALEGLRSQGYRIVLDDLVSNPQLHPLLRVAHAVRMDIGLVTEPSFLKQVSLLKTAGVELIAERIGSYEELRHATKLGFSQFQGSFLSRPDGFRAGNVPAGQLAGLELIALLQNPEAEIADIADIIRRDVSLSYRVLKVVNSAQYSLPRPLGSIEEAVVLVGTRKIVSWVGMINMSGLNNKPPELTRAAMIRARVCEMLGERIGRTDLQRFYVVGLFSVIEALLDVPADKALAHLPLATEIVDAITSRGGIMGEVLAGVVAYEAGDWTRTHIIGLEDEAVRSAFRAATIEVDETWSQLAE